MGEDVMGLSFAADFSEWDDGLGSHFIPLLVFRASYMIISSFSLWVAVSIGSSPAMSFSSVESYFGFLSPLEIAFLCALLQGLKNGSDFSADFDRNLLTCAPSCVYFCSPKTSLLHFKGRFLDLAHELLGQRVLKVYLLCSDNFSYRVAFYDEVIDITSRLRPICFWTALPAKLWIRLPRHS
ncbi:hypothetical protein Tco_0768234 [Tanacetum coccineum]